MMSILGQKQLDQIERDRFLSDIIVNSVKDCVEDVVTLIEGSGSYNYIYFINPLKSLP